MAPGKPRKTADWHLQTPDADIHIQGVGDKVRVQISTWGGTNNLSLTTSNARTIARVLERVVFKVEAFREEDTDHAE